MESEYRVIATTIEELEWVKNLLHELGVKISTPTKVKSGNLGVVFVASNIKCHTRMKWEWI